MAVPAKKSYKKKAYVGRRRAVARPRRRVVGTNVNSARLTETIEKTLITNRWTQFNDICLSDFVRASSLSENFQKFRITSLVFKVKPSWDTYVQTGSGVNAQVPTFYRMMDKDGTLPASGTLALMKHLGAKPVRFDDKILTFVYKPTVLQSIQLVGSGTSSIPGKPLTSPWLSCVQTPDTGSTVPSTVPHYGIAMYLDAYGLPADQPISIDVTATFEFKMPAYTG